MDLTLEENIIILNHIHGIIQIGKNEYNIFDTGRYAMHGASANSTSNRNEELLQTGKNIQGQQRKNLSSIIRGFKSSVTIEARKINAEFKWQSRFDDRIIRDEQSLKRIKEYIRNNPKEWRNDKLSPDNKKGN